MIDTAEEIILLFSTESKVDRKNKRKKRQRYNEKI